MLLRVFCYCLVTEGTVMLLCFGGYSVIVILGGAGTLLLLDYVGYNVIVTYWRVQ